MSSASDEPVTPSADEPAAAEPTAPEATNDPAADTSADHTTDEPADEPAHDTADDEAAAADAERPSPVPLRDRLVAEPRTVEPIADAEADARPAEGSGAAAAAAPGRPAPVPPVDPAAPLDPSLRLTPAEKAVLDAAPPPPPSRRFVLGTGVLVLLGIGGGVGWSFWRTRSRAPRTAPPALLDAARAERTLMARLDAELAADPARAPLLRQIRADHAAHAATLDAAVAAHTGATPKHEPVTAPATALRAVEQDAAAAAARRAARLTGRDAALLASIAACESTHVALLT
ncbi:MAG: hypothetical protein ACTHMS_16075 [Jatrophihabitans sp.]|uniref:hypothetical protein n=1 Tax=Jatrophihabitans sp. TaxID=1932789 RepID=UPI003F7F1098